MALAFREYCLICRELKGSVNYTTEEWRDDTSVETDEAISMINHFNTLEISMILFYDKVMLCLHLCFDSIEWVAHDCVCGAEEDATNQGVKPFFLPVCSLVIMSHFR
jgi:hypothetical protein